MPMLADQQKLIDNSSVWTHIMNADYADDIALLANATIGAGIVIMIITALHINIVIMVIVKLFYCLHSVKVFKILSS